VALVTHFSQLRVYHSGFDSAMRIFELTKRWPPEEKYGLTRQIRDSSRSVCGQIAEAWRRRRYPAHFISKLADADAEAAETQNWLLFAHACGYITAELKDELWATYEEIMRGLVGMMNNSDSWCGPANLVREEVAEYVV
jgi:four helix bundle protein